MGVVLGHHEGVAPVSRQRAAGPERDPSLSASQRVRIALADRVGALSSAAGAPRLPSSSSTSEATNPLALYTASTKSDLSGAGVEQRHQQQRQGRVEERELQPPQQRGGGNQ
jgi:hypothetical protein